VGNKKQRRWTVQLAPGTALILTVAWLIGGQAARRPASPTKTERSTVQPGQEAEIGHQYSQIVLPNLSAREKHALALQAKARPEKFLRESDAAIQAFSQKLERYVRDWLAGRVDGKFPKGFFAEWIDNEKTRAWRLVRPEEIRPEEQWYVLPSYDPDKELRQFSPDPHASYLKLIFLAPLGSKLIIEGDFPHARFMSYEILTSVDPLHPATGRDGPCEVPIVDVDIDPDPRHVNPFRVGADRRASARHYHIEFDLRAGNASELNPQAMSQPQYRAPGNRRVGGPFAFTGPYGGNVIVPSLLWLRYYAPDMGSGPLAGVPLPKAVLQLPSGEKYWITCDKSVAVSLQTSPVPRIAETPPLEPYPVIGPSLGWLKMYDIIIIMAEGRAIPQTKPWGQRDPTAAKKQIRDQFLLFFNRGLEATPPGNLETGPTCCNHISYLVRPISLGPGKVIVLTGRLPRFPGTRRGEPTMDSAEVRYFSITHQMGTNTKYNKGFHATPYGSLMDDEITVNGDREYVIVYSRPQDRPRNARPEHGVTWQKWGEPSSQGFVLRWLSVRPEWYLPKFAPDRDQIPWKFGAWSEDAYDKSLVSENRPGVMGPFHPVIGYLTKEEFERLGDRPLRPADIPRWDSR